MGGKRKSKKRRKGKGPTASSGDGSTPGAAWWRRNGGGDGLGGGGVVPGGLKYGRLTPEAVEAQMAAIATQMGLDCDAPGQRFRDMKGGGEVPEGREGLHMPSVPSGRDGENAADGDERAGGAVGVEAMERCLKRKRKSLREGHGALAGSTIRGRLKKLPDEGLGAQRKGNAEQQRSLHSNSEKDNEPQHHPSNPSAAPPNPKDRLALSLGWLLLEPGDVVAVSKAPKKQVVMWRHLMRSIRLVRAARLALGHPPVPRDLGICRELVTLLEAAVPPLLGPGVCHGALEDLLNARTCASALHQASNSLDELSNSMEPPGKTESPSSTGEQEGAGLPLGAAQAWVRLVCGFDELYFQMHYACRVSAPKGQRGDEGPCPADYLEAVAPRGGMKALMEGAGGLPKRDREALRRSLGLLVGGGGLEEVRMAGGCSPGSNDLLRAYWARLAEGAALFLRTGLAESSVAALGSGASGGGKGKKTKAKRTRPPKGPGRRMAPPLTPPIVQAWRDASRVWVARLYTFAVPTSEALRSIASLGKEVVEIGAGAGYWAHLLELEGAKVAAYDIAPPSSDGEWNDYHGQVPAFTTVRRGGPEVLRSHPGAALLLCFPPPGDDMAAKCLRGFSGDTVCHIGEWGGQTADEKFEELLLDGFDVLKVVSLPNWGNTHYALSIWTRKGTQGKEGGGSRGILSCSCCGAKVGDWGAATRSRLCHQLVYCSPGCREQHVEGRDAMARACLVPLAHRAEHFETLPVGGL